MNKQTNIDAVLSRLSIRIFPNTRQDSEITSKVLLEKALGLGAGKWVKHVLPDASLCDIREIGGEFRRRHYDITLPWEDGYRLLPATAHDAYNSELEVYSGKFKIAVAAFGKKYSAAYVVDATDPEAKAYFAMLHHLKQIKVNDIPVKGPVKLPSLVAQAKTMHNGTFNESLYPEWPRMEKNFDIGAEFEPVPKAAHFIAHGFHSKTVDAFKEQLEARNEQRIGEAVKDLWVRLLAPVKKIADTLSDKETIFRDTLIGNIREITDLVPKLNVTNDPALADIAKQIESKFANIDPNLLRSNVDTRKEVASAAKAIVAKFGQLGKRRFA